MGWRFPPLPASDRLFEGQKHFDYGASVELEPGIEGLVHCLEMDWTNKNVVLTRSSTWATKWKSWSWKSTKTSVVSPWA